MDCHDLKVERGGIESFRRHIVHHYQLLDSNTLIEIETVLNDRIKEIDLKIKNCIEK